jgi:hypothetical protein
MGLMRFLVHPARRLTDQRVGQVYMTGTDRTPWPTRARLDPFAGGVDAFPPSSDTDPQGSDTDPQGSDTDPHGDAPTDNADNADRRNAESAGAELLVERSVSDSGCLNIVWPVEGFGEVLLATSSLRERPEPYLLSLELARGALTRLKAQLADWQAIHLKVTPTIVEQIREAVRRFAAAVVHQDDPPRCAALADVAIARVLEAGEALTAAYTQQSFLVRRRNGQRLRSLLGVDLGDRLLDESLSAHVLRSFNAANVPVRWRTVEASEGARHFDAVDRQVQWCKTHGLTCFAGPLLRFDTDALPDWLTLWEGDFDNVLSCVSEFIQATVTRLRGKVDAWQFAGRINTGEMLDLSEQQKLNLTARASDLVGQLDPDRPRIISIDQPWAEYMGRRAADYPPLHLADALMRAGLDVSGIALEINLGLPPSATLPRTTLQMSRQLDLWSGVGLPIYLFVSAPGAASPDHHARRRQPAPGEWTTRSQQAWVARNVPLMLAKPFVGGVFWNQLADPEPHEFPHAGLVDARGRIKPSLRTLSTIRRTHLK